MNAYNDRIIAEFRANGGAVAEYGSDLVLLHTIGARSGQPRVHPLMALRDGDAWLVVGSKAGAPDHPAWYHNVLAHPDVELEVPDQRGGITTLPVRATVLDGAERDAGWQRFLDASEWFGRYAERAGRVIPVIRLAPR